MEEFVIFIILSILIPILVLAVFIFAVVYFFKNLKKVNSEIEEVLKLGFDSPKLKEIFRKLNITGNTFGNGNYYIKDINYREGYRNIYYRYDQDAVAVGVENLAKQPLLRQIWVKSFMKTRNKKYIAEKVEKVVTVVEDGKQDVLAKIDLRNKILYENNKEHKMEEIHNEITVGKFTYLNLDAADSTTKFSIYIDPKESPEFHLAIFALSQIVLEQIMLHDKTKDPNAIQITKFRRFLG